MIAARGGPLRHRNPFVPGPVELVAQGRIFLEGGGEPFRMPDRLGTDGDHHMAAAPTQSVHQGLLGCQVTYPLTDVGGILFEFTANRRQPIRITDRFAGNHTHPTTSDKTNDTLTIDCKPKRQIRMQNLPAGGGAAKSKNKASDPFKRTVSGIARLHIAVFHPSVRWR